MVSIPVDCEIMLKLYRSVTELRIFNASSVLLRFRTGSDGPGGEHARSNERDN
jgi:hypothetical protein